MFRPPFQLQSSYHTQAANTEPDPSTLTPANTQDSTFATSHPFWQPVPTDQPFYYYQPQNFLDDSQASFLAPSLPSDPFVDPFVNPFANPHVFSQASPYLTLPTSTIHYFPSPSTVHHYPSVSTPPTLPASHSYQTQNLETPGPSAKSQAAIKSTKNNGFNPAAVNLFFSNQVLQLNDQQKAEIDQQILLTKFQISQVFDELVIFCNQNKALPPQQIADQVRSCFQTIPFDDIPPFFAKELLRVFADYIVILQPQQTTTSNLATTALTYDHHHLYNFSNLINCLKRTYYEQALKYHSQAFHLFCKYMGANPFAPFALETQFPQISSWHCVHKFSGFFSHLLNAVRTDLYQEFCKKFIVTQSYESPAIFRLNRFYANHLEIGQRKIFAIEQLFAFLKTLELAKTNHNLCYKGLQQAISLLTLHYKEFFETGDKNFQCARDLRTLADNFGEQIVHDKWRDSPNYILQAEALITLIQDWLNTVTKLQDKDDLDNIFIKNYPKSILKIVSHIRRANNHSTSVASLYLPQQSLEWSKKWSTNAVPQVKNEYEWLSLKTKTDIYKLPSIPETPAFNKMPILTPPELLGIYPAISPLKPGLETNQSWFGRVTLDKTHGVAYLKNDSKTVFQTGVASLPVLKNLPKTVLTGEIRPKVVLVPNFTQQVTLPPIASNAPLLPSTFSLPTTQTQSTSSEYPNKRPRLTAIVAPLPARIPSTTTANFDLWSATSLNAQQLENLVTPFDGIDPELDEFLDLSTKDK